MCSRPKRSFVPPHCTTRRWFDGDTVAIATTSGSIVKNKNARFRGLRYSEYSLCTACVRFLHAWRASRSWRTFQSFLSFLNELTHRSFIGSGPTTIRRRHRASIGNSASRCGDARCIGPWTRHGRSDGALRCGGPVGGTGDRRPQTETRPRPARGGRSTREFPLPYANLCAQK